MSGCHPTNINKRADCIACNGGAWHSMTPPQCICNNPNPAIESLALCKHLKPVKFGCNECVMEGYYEDVSPMVKKIQELEDRIKEAEKDMNFIPSFESIKQVEDKIKELDSRLESQISDLHDNYRGLFHDTSHLEKKVYELENITKELVSAIRIKYPHKCPVCEGCGERKEPALFKNIPQFKTDSVGNVVYKCSSCEGKGIVWG